MGWGGVGSGEYGPQINTRQEREGIKGLRRVKIIY